MKLFLLGYLIGSVLAFFAGLDWARLMWKGGEADASDGDDGERGRSDADQSQA